MNIEFIEVDVFTKQILAILTDDEYSQLQSSLNQKPERGVLIPGGRGLRKLRWATGAKGKRGGARIIYYLQLSESIIYLVYAFKKTEKTDLSPKQLSALAQYVRELVL